jgi:hypothetical protein
MHIIFVEVSLIDLTRICEVIFALSVELALNEVALVHISVKFKFSLSRFLSVDKVSSVNNLVIVPLLSSFTVVGVILPRSFVHRALLVNKDSLSACLSFFPLALIDISVGVCHSSLSVEKSILSHSIVPGAIWELNSAKTLPNTIFFLIVFGYGPLASILPAFFDVDHSGVPEESLTASLWLGRELKCHLIICEEQFLCFDELSVFVGGLLLARDRFDLDELFKPSSGNSAGRPLFNNLDLLHWNDVFAEFNTLISSSTAATHIFK